MSFAAVAAKPLSVAGAPPSSSTTSPHPRQVDRTTVLLCRLLVASIAAFLIVGFAALVVWIALRPRLPDISVSSASLSSFRVSHSLLTSRFDFTLAARNPNKKMSIYYDRLQFAVLVGSAPISEVSLPPFSQTHGSSTLRAALAVEGARLSREAADKIGKNVTGGGKLTLRARVLSLVRFRQGAWWTRRHLLRVSCNGVTVRFKNTTLGFASMVGPPKSCEVFV